MPPLASLAFRFAVLSTGAHRFRSSSKLSRMAFTAVPCRRVMPSEPCRALLALAASF
jgi:hypothetical protein